MPAADAAAVVISDSTRLTAAARAQCDKLRCRWITPWWIATKAEEQAVSILMLGPLKPYRKDIRPAATEKLPPVAACGQAGWVD